MKEQITELLYQLLERHYNIDRRQPHVLTAKAPHKSTQIKEIGADLTAAFEKLIQMLVPAEEPTKNICVEDDDFSNYNTNDTGYADDFEIFDYDNINSDREDEI